MRILVICVSLLFAMGAFAQQANKPPTPPPAPPFGNPISLEQAETALQAAIAEAKTENLSTLAKWMGLHSPRSRWPRLKRLRPPDIAGPQDFSMNS